MRGKETAKRKTQQEAYDGVPFARDQPRSLHDQNYKVLKSLAQMLQYQIV